MFDPQITVLGNLTADPELRYTPNGKAVCNFNIAANHRVKEGNEWKDGETTFYRATVWEQMAENVAGSLRKGQQALVTGTVHTEKYTDRDGNERSSLILNVDEIGASLRFATAQVTRVQRGQGGQPQPAGNPAAAQSAGFGGQQAPQQDVWGGGGQQQAAPNWGGQQGQAPAFGESGGPAPF